MNPKAKGAGGEYEVIAILQQVLDKICLKMGFARIELSRNLEQSRYRPDTGAKGDARGDARGGSGNGSDIVGLDWIAIEVKRREQEQASIKETWWMQTKLAAMGSGRDAGKMVREPVLFSRKNRSPWEVRMYGWLDPGWDVRKEKLDLLGEPEERVSRVKVPVDVNLPNFLIYFEEKAKYELLKESVRKEEDAVTRERFHRRKWGEEGVLVKREEGLGGGRFDGEKGSPSHNDPIPPSPRPPLPPPGLQPHQPIKPPWLK